MVFPPSSSSSKSTPATPPEEFGADSYIYTGIVSTWLTNCNPWPAFKNTVKALLDPLANFAQNRRQTEQTLILMEARLQRMQTGFSTANPKIVGQRLDKIR